MRLFSTYPIQISESVAQKVSSWPHSGFNIHNAVEIDADDEKGKENLAQYIIKAPISYEYFLHVHPYDCSNNCAKIRF